MNLHDYVIAYLVAGMVYVGLTCRSAYDEVEREHGRDFQRRYFLLAAVLCVLLWPLAVAEGIRERLR